MAKNKKTSPARELLGWIVYIGIIVVLTWFIITFIGMRTRVVGSSMETTLSDGDNLIVDKLSYRFKDPERFDIVVFPHVEDSGEKTHYIKRIIGLPGETVQIINGQVYINGQVLDSDGYGLETMRDLVSGELGFTPLTLGEDEYFVLGDNRNNSSDSRNPKVGVLTRKELTGKALIRIYPFNKFGVIKHE